MLQVCVPPTAIDLEKSVAFPVVLEKVSDGTSEFLINSYGTPLAQRASYLALHSSLFGPDGAINYDYIVTNSINSLLIGSRCIPNGAHTNHC